MTTKFELLEKINIRIKSCKKCRLCEQALNAVPGEGNVESDIVFIGEAPGATEDATGRPFVGRAGKLLDMLLGQIDMKRSDVWIGNIIKHRPPQNRDPLPDEIASCQPYLTAQLEVIQPKLIVTLGRFSMSYFYNDGRISRDHGHPILLDKWIVFPLYHPAAALRNSSMAVELKKDFLRIPEILHQIRSGLLKPKNSKVENLKKEIKSTVPEGQMGLNL